MTYTNLIPCLFILFNIFLIINFPKIKFFKSNLDIPDKKRKIHSKPTPLAGGIILFLNMILYFFIINFNQDLILIENVFDNIFSFNIFILIYLFIFILGYFDDKFNLNANLKLIILTFLILILLIIDQNLIIKNIQLSFIKQNLILNNFGILFTLFCFLVFMNALNMFDGINLQSTIYSFIVFTSIYLFFLDSIMIKILIIFLIGFSYLNYRNKSFLGDSGTLALAFIIGYFFIRLYNLNLIQNADEIVIYMMIPGLDLIRLFVIRIFRKRNPLSSDRLHLHHLIISKYSFKTTIIIISLLIIIPIVLNYFDFKNFYNLLITIVLYSSTLLIIKKNN